MSYTWDFGDQSLSTGIGVTHLYGAGGDYIVTLTVEDNHGGVGVASNMVHVNHPPAFSSTPPTSVAQDALFQYLPVVTDVDGIIFFFDLVTSSSNMVMNPTNGELTWVPGNNDLGNHDVVLRVSDAFGASADQAFTLTVNNVNDDPIITSFPVTNAGVNALYVYQVRAEDPDEDPLMYSLTVFPSGMVISAGGRIEWTPQTNQLGGHAVTVRVQDPSLATALQSFTVNVTTNVGVPVADAESNQRYSNATARSGSPRYTIRRIWMPRACPPVPRP